jgi:hypothetical protein
MSVDPASMSSSDVSEAATDSGGQTTAECRLPQTIRFINRRNILKYIGPTGTKLTFAKSRHRAMFRQDLIDCGAASAVSYFDAFDLKYRKARAWAWVPYVGSIVSNQYLKKSIVQYTFMWEQLEHKGHIAVWDAAPFKWEAATLPQSIRRMRFYRRPLKRAEQ